MGIFLSPEETIPIIFCLYQTAREELFRVQGRNIYVYLSGRNVVGEPQEKLQDQDDTDNVMKGNGGLELRKACDFLVSDLCPGENKGQKTENVYPVPYPYWQRMEVYLLTSPSAGNFLFFLSGKVNTLRLI